MTVGAAILNPLILRRDRQRSRFSASPIAVCCRHYPPATSQRNPEAEFFDTRTQTAWALTDMPAQVKDD